jgi:hypothetical protein
VRLGCEAKRNDATFLRDALHFAQSGNGVWPVCMELIASTLSKTLSSNGRLPAEPSRRSTRRALIASSFTIISLEGSTPATGAGNAGVRAAGQLNRNTGQFIAASSYYLLRHLHIDDMGANLPFAASTFGD